MKQEPKKHCVVVGASSGIGKEVSELLVGKGYRVFGFARRFETDLQNENSDFVKRHLDVSCTTSVDNAFKGLPNIDVFVYSAGGALFVEPLETTHSDIQAMWDVHVKGAWSCLTSILPSMTQDTSAALVVGSISGKTYTPGCMAYSMAKTAQRVMWEHMANPCKQRGIRTTHVALGAVDTPLWDSIPNANRQDMLKAKDIAQKIVLCVTDPTHHKEDMIILPKKGILKSNELT